MKAKKITPKQDYFIRLSRDEEVIATLTKFCAKEKITSGSFRAIGAVKDAKIGFYDLAKKKYGTVEYPHEMEVATMTGNVSLVNGGPFIHVHAILSDMRPGHENETIGGHVFSATVAVTLEVHLESFKGSIERVLDNDIGLKLLDI